MSFQPPPRSAITTAEEDARSETRTDQVSGAVPPSEQSLYHETQFTNYTGYDVVVVYHDGGTFLIKPVFDVIAQPRIEVRWRRNLGTRTVQNGRDTTPSATHTRSVPLTMLNEGPVYLHTHDLMFCLPEHVDRVVHPNSNKSQAVQLNRLYLEMTRRATASPLLITANDPQGRSERLYTIVHGEVCAIDVRHFSNAGESDVITVMARAALDNGGITNKVLGRTTFETLRATPTGVAAVGGVPVALTREQLKRYLEKPTHREEMITIGAHEAALQDRDRSAAAEEAGMRDEIKLLTEQLAQARKVAEHYRDTKHSDKTAELNMEKLRLEKEKLHHEQQRLAEERTRTAAEQAHTAEVARIKRQETLISTAGSVIKVAGIALALYMSLRKK